MLFRFFICLFTFLSPLISHAQWLEGPEYKRHKYFISVCAMFQNEERFLKEWIEYHKLIGAEHFYLYDNNSTDNYWDVLAPYIASGEVELYTWHSDPAKDWTPRQVEAISHAVGQAVYSSEWLAIIDIDEFIVPTQHETLTDLLKEHTHYGSVAGGWRFFGTSWVEKIPEEKLLIETLIRRCPFIEGQVWLHKSIVRPQAVRYPHIHDCGLFPGVDAVNYANKEEYPPLLIHHYWARDIDFLVNVKQERQERLHKNPWSEEELQAIINANNAIEDSIMMRFIPELRKRVFN